MANYPYTTNYCRNPSLQMGLSGFSTTQNSTISLDTTVKKYGKQSLFVNCPGEKAGEGCITSGGVIPGDSLCTGSVYIQGSGSVTVYAVLNPGGVIVASLPVTCTEQWERVSIEGISCTAGQTLFLMVTTTTAYAAKFWLSGIQIEDNSFVHPYCDGDQDGCEWIEGFWGGVSICYYENPVVASSHSSSYSPYVTVLDSGRAFYITPIEVASTSYSDLVYVSGPGPDGAVTNFAVAQLTDLDPAETYSSWNNGGVTLSTSAYTRVWGTFYPPIDQIVSDGSYMWKRAAYMAAGFYFVSVPNNGTVNLTRVQTEVLPITTAYAAASPTSFDPPRAIHSIVKPDRLNYCTNPSIEVSTSGWSGVGTGTVSQDATKSATDLYVFDEAQKSAGTHSLKVIVNANGDGAQISIGNLITGDTYIASVYAQPGQGFADILMQIGGSSATALGTGGTGYGTGAYGSGPYGGISPLADLSQTTWYRIYCVFTATSDTHVLQVTSSTAGDVALPTDMWIDAVLVEPGELLQNYFDGGFGTGYSWETGGTTGLARSYYYDQLSVKQRAFLNVLDGHTPLGIEADTPQYSVSPIS